MTGPQQGHAPSVGAPGATGMAWAVAAALSVAALGVGLLWIPAAYPCPWGVNAAGAAHFRGVLHVPALDLDVARFRVGFLTLIALAWLTYLGLLATGLAGAALPPRRIAQVAAATALVLAVFAPPALSPDVYAYVGYARLQVIHHLNPYVETQRTLARLGDLTAPFLRWPISSPYGPLWTWLSIAVVFVLPHGGLWAPVVVMKLFGAVSVLAMAEAGRRLARRLASRRGDLVFAAIALNPLFLLEGVASGHNDVVMMAFVLWALVAVADDRFARGFGLLGVAAAIKFVPLMLAPWVLMLAWRREGAGRRLLRGAQALALSALPLLLTFAGFWRGGGTLAGLGARSSIGQRLTGGDVPRRALALALVYAALTVWVARGALPRLMRGWILASCAVVVLASGLWFPWYFVWPWAVALVLIDGRDVVFAAVCYGGVLTMILRYVS